MKNFHETNKTNITITEKAKLGIQYFNWDLDEVIAEFEQYGDEQITITDADLHRVFYTVNNKHYEMDIDGNIEEV